MQHMEQQASATCTRAGSRVSPFRKIRTTSRFCNTSNPLRAGLVKNSCDWKYSSLWLRNFKSANKNTSETLRQNSADSRPVIVGLAYPVKLPADWNKQVNIIPTETDQLIIDNCIKRGTPYGGETWTKRTAQKLGLESTIRSIGRPSLAEKAKVELS